MPFTLVSAQVVSYPLEDGRNTLDETNSSILAIFSTDSAGLPVSWTVSASTADPVSMGEIGGFQPSTTGASFASWDEGVIKKCGLSSGGQDPDARLHCW
jgi:hypothetical protein